MEEGVSQGRRLRRALTGKAILRRIFVVFGPVIRLQVARVNRGLRIKRVKAQIVGGGSYPDVVKQAIEKGAETSPHDCAARWYGRPGKAKSHRDIVRLS